MQARKRCKGHDDARDASEAALRGRQRCKGGNNAREAIIIALSLSMQCAIIVILIVINIFFSSFNDVDLSHIMLVDCCMLCCWECGPIAAVWWRRLPWWLNWIAFLPILPSFISRYTRHKSAQPQVRPQTNHLSNQISLPILSGWGWFKKPSSAHVCWKAACIVLKRIWNGNDDEISNRQVLRHVLSGSKCMLGKFGHTLDLQDDVGWGQSQVVMWPSGHALHAYTLYWAIGFSSNVL